MSNSKFPFTQAIYTEYLTSIAGKSVSKREADVLACILSGRPAKGIGRFLSISDRTVESHMYNIMTTFECSSRESLISFIERSDKFLSLREYYVKLLAEVNFENLLKKIAYLTIDQKKHCSIFYSEKEENIKVFSVQIKKYLKLVGIETSIEGRERIEWTDFTSQKTKPEGYQVYIIPEKCKNGTTLPFSKILIKNVAQGSFPNTFFLFLDKHKAAEIPKELPGVEYIDFTERDKYYFSIFELLKKLFPTINFDTLIKEFKEQYNSINGTFPTEPSSKPVKVENDDSSQEQKKNVLVKRKWYLLGVLIAVIGMFSIGGITYFTERENQAVLPKPKLIVSSIRSDLPIPSATSLLNRSELLALINDNFKRQGGIQTIALVGIGGSGKTTLARQYAHQQKENVVWEINAETSETLRGSFEKLAEKLVKTEKDKDTLRNILIIKDSEKRQEKLLELVKILLRTSANWLLIYDNVERFSDIQHCFPLDPKTWGNGKVLLTTRDATIHNNSQVNSVIYVDALTDQQKIDLFSKIMDRDQTSPFTSREDLETINFLKHLPPFPLDISVAAYYLKATHITYEKYLNNLGNYVDDFNIVQQDLLEQAGEYAKTRYSIVAQSLDHIIRVNKEFEGLLLLMSLIDSQNIPRDLLEHYKKGVIDTFILHLKKHSLLTSITSATLSLHRSTQNIILAYLKRKLDLHKKKEEIEKISLCLENYIYIKSENCEYAALKLFIPHCEAFLRHENLLTRPIKEAISVGLGGICAYNFFPEKAQNILKKMLPNLKENFTENHDRIAHALLFLGISYWDVGDTKKHKLYLEKSSIMYKESANHLGFANSLLQLSHWAIGQGHYEKAKNLAEEGIKIYKRYYPENHVRIGRALSFLGVAYCLLGQYRQAEKVLEESRSIYEKHGLEKNPQGTQRILMTLGRTYWKMGNYEKAQKFVKESIDIGAKHMAADCYAVVCNKMLLGSIYIDLHRYKEAKPLLEEGYIFFEKNYGKYHFLTAHSLRDLGQLFLAENDIKNAETCFTRALNIFQETKHVEIYSLFESLADVCLKKSSLAYTQGDTQQAQYFKSQAMDYLQQSLEIVQTHFPADSAHRKRIEQGLKGIEEI